ncbi:MAG TPA: glycosyltransferase family 2 protein [Candidatus Polarisedimenticolia bacterium]|nr:glycosyltransferase family 2 protein [Candidatus Polarisedimenticolia bacterium]
MILLFWTLCGLTLYAYVGYPVLIWLLSLLAGRSRRTAGQEAAWRPMVSILIPAYNEQEVIGRKIENTLSLDYPADKREIIIASESDDATDSIVRRYAGQGVTLLSSSVRRGKVANLARAVPASKGEILVFTDANALVRPDALRLLVRHFADLRVGAVSARLVYRDSARAASAAGEEAYWGLEMLVKRASSRLGSLPGANGSMFCLRRDLYLPISVDRGDDFELPIRAILHGYDSILEPRAVTQEEASATFRDEYRRKVRIINWMVVSALILLREALEKRRWLLAFQLLSHKLNRWAVPFYLLALLPISLWLAPRGEIYLAAAWAQCLLYALALAGLLAIRAGRGLKVLTLPLYFVVVNAASFVGLVTRALGRDVAWHKRPDAVV